MSDLTAVAIALTGILGTGAAVCWYISRDENVFRFAVLNLVLSILLRLMAAFPLASL